MNREQLRRFLTKQRLQPLDAMAMKETLSGSKVTFELQLAGLTSLPLTMQRKRITIDTRIAGTHGLLH